MCFGFGDISSICCEVYAQRCIFIAGKRVVDFCQLSRFLLARNPTSLFDGISP